MGVIQDRTTEHLGQSDKAINAYRRLLRQAIDDTKSGGRPLMVLDAKAAHAEHAALSREIAFHNFDVATQYRVLLDLLLDTGRSRVPVLEPACQGLRLGLA